MREVIVTTVGNSLGVALPEDVLAKLKVGEGDRLLVVETATGVELSVCDAEVAGQLAVAKEFMGKYRNVLRRLAE
ncbi:MAG TPA: hypothetical protein VHR66_02930 [Gemmataceae bacterium]|jgi:putative addiction module antidote|nr:hypothetical protein [Gemmataceae bacterium]